MCVGNAFDGSGQVGLGEGEAVGGDGLHVDVDDGVGAEAFA